MWRALPLLPLLGLARGLQVPRWGFGCEHAVPVLKLAGHESLQHLCAAAENASEGLALWAWTEHEVIAIDRVSTKLKDRRSCERGGWSHDAAGVAAVADCLEFYTNHVLRLVKQVGDMETASVLLNAAHAALPDLVRLWPSVDETPYSAMWDIRVLHSADLRPPEKGWWPHNTPGIEHFIAALEHSFPHLLADFQRVRSSLGSYMGKGGPDPERHFWGGVPFYSASSKLRPGGFALPSGWTQPTCKLLPRVCEVLAPLLPTTEHPFLYAPGESVNLQRIEAGGFLHLHNDPERVTIQQCLSGCEGAWLRVGQDRVFFGHPGRILAFDNIYDHSAGNDGKEDRWILNLVISHPDYNRLYTSMSPRPARANRNSGHVDWWQLACMNGPRCIYGAGLPTPGESARGRLGSEDSTLLGGFRYAAEEFDCEGRREGFHAHKESLNMKAGTVDWQTATAHLRLAGLPAAHAVQLPEAAMEEARAGCRRMQGFFQAESHSAANGSQSGRQLVDDFGLRLPKELTLWTQRDGQAGAAAEVTRDAVQWHLDRLAVASAAYAIIPSVHFAGALRESWKPAVAERTALMLEHVFYLQLVNAYALAHRHGAGEGLPPPPPLPPVSFYDFFADRVGVLLSALGGLALQPDKLFVEVGVGAGPVALGILRNTRMRYLGMDHYNQPDGGELQWADVTNEIKTLAGPERSAELWRMSAAQALPKTGMATVVWVEGSHYRPLAGRDLVAWWSKVSPGGFLFVHDAMKFFGAVAMAIGGLCQQVACGPAHLGMDAVFWIEKPLA